MGIERSVKAPCASANIDDGLSYQAIRRLAIASVRALALERGVEDVSALTDFRNALLAAAVGDAALERAIAEAFLTESIWSDDASLQ
ncbi:hypothetical protein ACFQU1_23810 [Chelatococcus sp. GCM10030263]|uniref:hypothetical protein n=1 Tax=Chelatococcus sp. GCM10030263 TaxID=3273387 RepID=UPI0036207CEE